MNSVIIGQTGVCQPWPHKSWYFFTANTTGDSCGYAGLSRLRQQEKSERHVGAGKELEKGSRKRQEPHTGEPRASFLRMARTKKRILQS